MTTPRTTTLSLAYTSLIALLSTSPAAAEIVQFIARIDGEQARECQGTDSPATGIGSFTLDTETGEVSYLVSFEEDELLGNETFAHVHGPAEPCAPGKIVYDLPLGAVKEGTARLDAPAMQAMLDGLHYINIHSTEVGPGEIRGQIVRGNVHSPLPATTPWGTVIAVAGAFALGALTIRTARLDRAASPQAN